MIRVEEGRPQQRIMYCPNCGIQNAEGVAGCLNCGDALGRIQTPDTYAPPPETVGGTAGGTGARSYLVRSIVLTTLRFMLAFLTFALNVPAVFTGAVPSSSGRWLTAGSAAGTCADVEVGEEPELGRPRAPGGRGFAVGALIFVLIFFSITAAKNPGTN
jgi:hypothetical protein